MHLQAVLAGVGRVEDLHLRQVGELGERPGVHSDPAERSLEELGAGGRETSEGHVVAGAQQDDPANGLACPAEAGVGGGRDRARIDVTGVGRDEGLGGRAVPGGVGGVGGVGKERLDRLAKLLRVVRVEHPRHGGPAHDAHA